MQLRRPPDLEPGAVFDELAPTWDEQYDRRSDFRARRAAVGAALKAELARYEQPLVLDLGGGTGVLAALAAPGAGHVVLVDASERMVRAGASPAAPGDVSRVVGDAASVPSASGRFDVIVCVAVLEWLTDVDGAVEEMARLLAPGGTILLSVPRPRSILRRVEAVVDRAASTGLAVGAPWATRRRYAAARPHGSKVPWRDALARQGLEVIAAQGLAFGTAGWRAQVHPSELIVARAAARPDASGAERRREREARFHDDAHIHRSRRVVAPSYRVLVDCRARYLALLSAGAGPGARVLELGCGASQTAVTLARRGAEVHAIDLAAVVVRAARAASAAEGVSIHHQRMDGEQLAYVDGAFDLVYGSGVLHHLDLRGAPAEIARVLAPGGRAVFMEPLGHNPIINGFRRVTPWLRTPDEHPLLVADLEALAADFELVDVEFFALLSLLALPVIGTRLAPGLLRRLGRLDALVFDRWPATRPAAWYCVVALAAPEDVAALDSHAIEQV